MEPGPRTGRERRQRISIAVAAAASLACAGIASASGGGVGSPSPPTLSAILCLERCGGVREATGGSLVQLSGRNLDGVDEVRFAARRGGIAIEPASVTARTVEVEVPARAETGTVIAAAYGVEAETPRSRPLEIVPARRIPDPGPFELTAAEAVPRQAFYDGARPPRVSYVFQGSGAIDVRVSVVDRASGEVVATSIQAGAQPGTTNTATWNRRLDAGGRAPGGDYRFRVGPAAGGGTAATEDSAFGYHLWRFPLDAPHTFGDGYGAGRGHEGQDIFARCETPILAARGGRVQTVDTHGAAGHYVVVDGKGTGLDTVYSHMARPSPLSEGARVRTGQVVGHVGRTGNASDCHLHFEIWSAAGWYEGGQAMTSVGRLLRNWDSWS